MDILIKMLVIGLDGATWKVIKDNINEFPTIKKLMNEGYHKTITVRGKPLSVPLWCTIFSGKKPEEHGHEEFVVNGKLLHRDDINLDFIWDILNKQGYKAFAINIPFVLPPYNFNTQFDAISYGLPETEEEWEKELWSVTEKAKDLLQTKPDLLCVVYTLLDRVQHYYWGSSEVVRWYKKIDDSIKELIQFDNKIILLSDHGFCSFGEAKIKTLKKANIDGREVKGDHHEEAILIAKNINYDIKNPEDIFYAIVNEFNGNKNGTEE